MSAIVEFSAMTIRAALPEPIHFGDWVMHHREFALVRVSNSDSAGYAFTLTRDGPVSEIVRQYLAPRYIGTEAVNRSSVYSTVKRSNLATLSAGVGLRALSLVDLAVWDLHARNEGKSIAELLGGSNQPMPATAIIGYPPSIGPDEVYLQTAQLLQAGWRRFKMPMGATFESTYKRLQAAAEAAPNTSLSLDGAWMFRTAAEALEFLEKIPVDLDWFEDAFPPGDARMVAALHKGSRFRIAMGDEQGGSYYPESLLAHKAVDIVRLDVTCMGGISGMRSVIDQAGASGTLIAPHMFAHIHSQVFAGLGMTESPVEWGVPGTGVDQYADSLRQPEISEGFMAPLPDEPGFGPLFNVEWLAQQQLDDPEHMLDELRDSELAKS